MRNLILASGPGSPASIMYAANLRNRALRSRFHEDDGGDDVNDDGEVARLAWTQMVGQHNTDDQDDDDEEEDDEEDDDDDDEDAFGQEDCEEVADFLDDQARETAEGRSHHSEPNLDAMDTDRDDDDEVEQPCAMEGQESLRSLPLLDAVSGVAQQPCSNPRSVTSNRTSNSIFDKTLCWKPGVRHEGCINTACWMTVPWRLAAPPGMVASLNSNIIDVVEDMFGGIESCPTQLATSGDDRVVKLWDARYAMGTANPLVGGWDTYCPLSTTERPSGFQSKWKQHYQNNPHSTVAGSIIPLATVATGHRGNVFDITPLPQQPGRLVTCAADGYLRLVDVVSQSSAVVINPLLSYGEESSLLPHSGLAFSHRLLSAQTGLLCSDRGLHLFDLRLSPREQARRSLITDSFDSDNAADSSHDSFSSSSRCCKACSVWRPSAAETDSHYVFAGFSSAVVALYDLRVDGSRRQIVESYKPRGIHSMSDISVSGLDVSRDGKELLVSYECDQIYAFPILGQKTSSPAGPTLDDIDSWAADSGNRRPVTEAMRYGGHLNRFTFLKNARYAGPHDEYICTGSDSGHAWVMERDTGTVVSLMSADTSTCNGVVPHPYLPFFITYGIDSTARIWRATTPVDPSVNDSNKGRALCAQDEKFEMSPVAQSPKVAQMLCTVFKNPPGILPDFIATRKEIATSGKFTAPNRRGMVDYESPRIGNSYSSLPFILRSNRYECYRTAQTEMAIPIDESGLRPFTVRVCLCRLRHQALRLGVTFSLRHNQPWNFHDVGDTHPADLVPDHPSDWILLDERMNPNPLKLDHWHFNWKDWSEYLLSRNNATYLMKQFAQHQEQGYSLLYDPPVWLRSYQSSGQDDFAWPVRPIINNKRPEEVQTEDSSESVVPPRALDEEEDEEPGDEPGDEGRMHFSNGAKTRSQRYLYETAFLLKEGGNLAMKNGQLDTAARRYDKAIQYCSVAFMRYCEGNGELAHLKEYLCVEGYKRPDSLAVVWSPLLRVLITARLNMALLLLKPRFLAAGDASTQAAEALRLLAPFTVRSGDVVVGEDTTERIVFDDEPETTFLQAKALQAKAYFRLGSAEMEQGDWSAAVEAFQASICCSEKPDSLVTRRLQEAKTKRNSKKKRDRRRFEVALGDETHQEK